MFKTRRYLAAGVVALSAMGALGATSACTAGFRVHTAVVAPRDGDLERRANDVGYPDGLDAGRSDAGHNRPYDPARSSRYRAGDHGYDRRLGPREVYARAYRAAFERGYSEGYGTGVGD